MIGLNPSQKLAVEKTSGTYSVVASAGGGKTHVLVEKFIHLVVNEGVSPDEILSITFTKKAAAEMKFRIVNRLRDLEKLEEAQVAETGPISTIHSFCERLLRENAIAARINPKFEIIEEKRAFGLRNDAVAEACFSAISELPEVQSFITKNSGSKNYLIGDELLKILSGAVSGRSNFAPGLDHFFQTYESFQTFEKRIIEELSKTDLIVQNLATEGHGLIDIFRLKKIKESEAKKRRTTPKEFPVEQELEVLQDSWAFGKLICEAITNYRGKLEQLQSFDFAMLEEKAVALVGENPDVRIRLQNQYKAILIDETQDVNSVQYKLLESLGIPHQMSVGDPQQSIYGFRGSNPRLFAEKNKNQDCINLHYNYRSTPAIINFVNDFFEKEWPGLYNAMSSNGEVPKPLRRYEGVEIWNQDERDYAQIALNINALIQEGTAPKDIAVLTRANHDCDAISESLKELEIPSVILSSSDRFYTRMESRDLANGLQVCTSPHDDFALASFLLSPYIQISYDALITITSQLNGESIWHTIDTTELELPAEDQAKLKRFKEWFGVLIQVADRLPAWEVISELFHRTPVMENIGSHPNRVQIIANMRKLLRDAAKNKDILCTEMATIFRQTVDIRHKENEAQIFQDQDSVSLLTIHSAKGLEFPTVILPSTGSSLVLDNKSSYIDKQTGLIVFNSAKGSTYNNWLQSLRKRADREESIRLLYVAMTRAKERLCIISNTKDRKRESYMCVINSNLKFPHNHHSSIKVRTPAPKPPVDSQQP